MEKKHTKIVLLSTPGAYQDYHWEFNIGDLVQHTKRPNDRGEIVEGRLPVEESPVVGKSGNYDAPTYDVRRPGGTIFEAVQTDLIAGKQGEQTENQSP